MKKDAFVHKVLFETGLHSNSSTDNKSLKEIADVLDQYEKEMNVSLIDNPELLAKYLGNKNVQH